MFKVSRSGHAAIRPAQSVSVAEKPTSSGRLGTTSKGKRIIESADGNWESTSSPSMRVTGAPNATISGNAITIDVDPMLTGMTPQTEHVLNVVYKDMYYNDPVCGCAVDLISMMPFSEFNLGGLTGESKQIKLVHETYMESLERLNTRTLLPEVAVDYLVLGSHCSSLLYNKEKRLFVDVLPHQAEHLTIEPLPFYSQDPIITVKFPDEVKSILGRTDSKRIKRIREYLGAGVVDKIIEGEMELDPLSTIFIPRRTFSKSDKGTSYLRRVLPIYLIEKNLFRGTLVESARRQRGIMHISLGDGDQWVPTVQDMEFITELFMNADSDPVGAIIATRMGVQVDEIRQGGDFWKSSDFADSVLSHKLRALGISEAFLSGDSTFNTSDNALTVFLETVRSFRDMMTRKFFYNKLFPLISLISGFTSKNGKIAIQPELINQISGEEALFKLNDGSKLFIPNVHWTKQLKPEGDSSYLELLQTLTDKGVPIPLRAMAAAGGMDLDQLISQQEEDIAVRKRTAEYLAKIAALAPKEESGEGESESSDRRVNRAIRKLRVPLLPHENPHGNIRSATMAQHGRVPLLSRNFDGYEPYLKTKTDKVRPIPMHQRARYDAQANDKIVKAVKALDKKAKK